MSSEGVTLVARMAVVIYLIVVASMFRVLVGSGKRRDLLMLAGTLGGLASGVFVAYLLSHWIKTDVSVICASFSMSLGWGVAWLVARHVPREAH